MLSRSKVWLVRGDDDDGGDDDDDWLCMILVIMAVMIGWVYDTGDEVMKSHNQALPVTRSLSYVRRYQVIVKQG